MTGTNGKTTTSRMIEQAFADAGLRYFSNKSGANLLTGIIAVFAQHATLSGKMPLHHHALIECDEAAFRRTSEYLPRRSALLSTTSSATSSTATARSRTR